MGDPQQLPATVLSAAAKAGLFERSLFERLRHCGAQSIMLTVQYRMHPRIRAWPSSFFYNNRCARRGRPHTLHAACCPRRCSRCSLTRVYPDTASTSAPAPRLEDAASVVERPEEPYHGNWPLQPYAVFDVAEGREARGSGGSVRNLEEADLAVALYSALRAASPPGSLAGSVAVISPYREQRDALRRALQQRHADALVDCAVDTIDGFQGQERNVVIFSAVRAGQGGNVRQALGFVTDVRRMNVRRRRLPCPPAMK